MPGGGENSAPGHGRMIQDLITFQVMVQALHIGQDIEGSISEDLSGCEGDGNAVAVGLGI